MSAMLIVSASGTDDPGIQQERAAEGSSEVAASLDKEQQHMWANLLG